MEKPWSRANRPSNFRSLSLSQLAARGIVVVAVTACPYCRSLPDAQLPIILPPLLEQMDLLRQTPCSSPIRQGSSLKRTTLKRLMNLGLRSLESAGGSASLIPTVKQGVDKARRRKATYGVVADMVVFGKFFFQSQRRRKKRKIEVEKGKRG